MVHLNTLFWYLYEKMNMYILHKMYTKKLENEQVEWFL